MAVSPIHAFAFAMTTVVSPAVSQWVPAVPRHILEKAQRHLEVEGGTARVCFIFDVKAGQPMSCRVSVEGPRKDVG